MATCVTVNCPNSVSRPEFKLCLSCWRKQNSRNDNAGSYSRAHSQSQSDGKDSKGYITASKIAEHFKIKPQRINAILNELGWVERGKKGWNLTAFGSRMRAQQKRHNQSGVPYTEWPSNILNNRILKRAIFSYAGRDLEDAETAPSQASQAKQQRQQQGDAGSFRDSFRPNFRTNDGHFVRSKAEVMIDNFLYTSGLAHAYERKLPIEEDVYCDFYLPEGKVYIEYWGLENDPKYLDRKKVKKQIYRANDFNLIELDEQQIKNLDDYLPGLLLRFNIAVD